MKSILLLTILAIAITVCIAIPAIKVDKKDSIDIKTIEVQKTISTNAGQKTSGDARIATKQATGVKTSSVKAPENEVSQASKGRDTTEEDSNNLSQGTLERKQTTDVQKTVVVSQATKQTLAVKPVSQTVELKTLTVNDDPTKRSEGGLTSKSTSTVSAGDQQTGKTQDIKQSTAGQTISMQTKKIELSSGKDTSSSDDLNGRSEVSKSTSQGSTIYVENETKKGSSDQGSVRKKIAVGIQKVPQTSGSESVRTEVRTTSSAKSVAVERPVASQAVSSQSSEESEGSSESSEGRLTSRNSQSGVRNGRGQADQVNGGQLQVSDQLSEERFGGRQKSSSGVQGRSNERSGLGQSSNERLGSRSNQGKGGRRY